MITLGLTQCPTTRIGIWACFKRRSFWVRLPGGARIINNARDYTFKYQRGMDWSKATPLDYVLRKMNQRGFWASLLRTAVGNGLASSATSSALMVDELGWCLGQFGKLLVPARVFVSITTSTALPRIVFCTIN